MGWRPNVVVRRPVLPAGGYGAARSELNACYGNEPGVSFYSHLSDQFGAFYTKVIAATAHEAPHILDGLLLHETSLKIEEHATDTGGFTEIIFGLCSLLGFVGHGNGA